MNWKCIKQQKLISEYMVPFTVYDQRLHEKEIQI